MHPQKLTSMRRGAEIPKQMEKEPFGDILIMRSLNTFIKSLNEGFFQRR